jgi:hypothetical protein
MTRVAKIAAAPSVSNVPPAPEGQQVPPMGAAASDSCRSLRSAHGSLPLTSGTASPRCKPKGSWLRIDRDSWHSGYDAGRVGAPFIVSENAANANCRWSWCSGYIEGKAAQKRGSSVTRKLDAGREH